MKRRTTARLLSIILSLTLLLGSTITVCAEEYGIDVSKFNGAVNWTAVAGAGKTFAFIKAGSTKSGVDPMFGTNMLGAQAAGLRTGVYLYSYASSVEEAAAEANLLLQWMAPYTVNFPVVYDIEDSAQMRLDANTVTAMCNTFCDIINGSGYTPMVYTNANFSKKKFTAALRYDRWIAQYAAACTVPFDIWQHSCTATVPGIKGKVDSDYMLKDYRALIPGEGFQGRENGIVFFRNYRRQFGWFDFEGQRYHTGTDGYLNFGWFNDESGTYYLSMDNGRALTGLNAIDGDCFYFDEIGRTTGGWVTLGDTTYFFNPENGCRMLTGWFDDETGRHYLSKEDGHLLKNEAPVIDGKEYLFTDTGVMYTGWYNTEEATYFYAPEDGHKVLGSWYEDEGGKHYLAAEDGHMVTGLVEIPLSKKKTGTFFFNEYGVIQLGWQTIGEAQYYFNPADGTLVRDTLIPDVDGTYYTAPDDGHKVTNTAVVIKKKLHIFNEQGYMVFDQDITLGDRTYHCDENGVAVDITPEAE